MKRSTRWLDRRIAAPGPYLALALNQAEFDAARKALGVREHAEFVVGSADATAHYMTNPDGKLAVVVGFRYDANRSGIEIAGLFVHEAVHVWQEYARSIGETHPGDEQEAYAVQSIAQELMAEFVRRAVP